MSGCNAIDILLVVNEKLRQDDGSKKSDASLYRSLVGSLLYLTSTRPNIIFDASLLSRYMQSPTLNHMGAAKKVLRYLQGTLDYEILYQPMKDSKLVGFSDSDWAGCLDDIRSTSSYVFSLGSGICSWSSKKQKIVV